MDGFLLLLLIDAAADATVKDVVVVKPEANNNLLSSCWTITTPNIQFSRSITVVVIFFVLIGR